MSSALMVAPWWQVLAAVLLCTTTSALYVHSERNTFPSSAEQDNPVMSDDDVPQYNLNEGEGRELLQYLLSKSARMPNSLQDAPVEFTLQQSKGKRGGMEEVPVKRFTEFGLPYYKYKRNNGIWIWMPAHGYVSVPKDQQALTNNDAAKQGKIMRYGK